MSEDPNVFAGAFVDRSGERRKDPDWLAEALEAQQDIGFPTIVRPSFTLGGTGGNVAAYVAASVPNQYLPAACRP